MATDNRWAAATVGSMLAGELELATGASVMAIGGFTGGDDAPTLDEFQGYVAAGEVRYFVAGGPGDPRRGTGAAAQIDAWVRQNFPPTDVGGVMVFDLQHGHSVPDDAHP